MIEQYTVIIPLHLPWDWSADFLRQTALTLAKNNNKVIIYLYHEGQFFLKKKETSNYPKIKNITFHYPKYYFPLQRFSIIKEYNDKLAFLLLVLREQFHSKGKKILFWTFDPMFYYLVPLCIGMKTIYDCVDDTDWSKDTGRNLLMRVWERKLIRSIDMFFVISQSLYTQRKKIRIPDAVVPQGFAIEDFSNTKTLSPKNKEKIVGYVGGINSRFDWILLSKVIQRLPKIKFYFYGPIQEDRIKNTNHIQRKVDTLSKFSNVRFFSKKYSRKQIAKIIQTFTICIIPYEITLRANFYSYPMKLFEYFYWNKKVISTPLRELYRFKKYIIISNNEDDWIQSITGRQKTSYTRNLSIANSWDSKLEVISKEIENNV